MDIKFETFDAWPYGGKGDKRSPFKASYPKTVALLRDELTRASARNAAIQSGHLPQDIRFDGLPKVNARPPRPPAGPNSRAPLRATRPSRAATYRRTSASTDSPK